MVTGVEWTAVAEAFGLRICDYHRVQVRHLRAGRLDDEEYRGELRMMREEMARCSTGCVTP